jgi:hypothetical protein
MSYWLYQHLGNLAPSHLADDALYAQVRRADDAGALLREFAFRADREVAGTRWSYCRDFGRSRLLMIDSRAGRVLDPGQRSMLDEEEWRWFEEHTRGDFDHLLIGSSLPLLLAPGLHYLEAWNEAVCEGAWGRAAAWAGERMRQGMDLEHWAAFGRSLDRAFEIVGRAAAGRHGGRPPASIVALSGDVHHAYLAEVAFRRELGARSAVYQAVCSPFRNPLDEHERRGIRFACSKAGTLVGRTLARAAGVGDPPVRWRFAHDEPWFDNQVCFVELDGRRSRLWLQKTVPEEDDGYALETVFERELAAG